MKLTVIYAALFGMPSQKFEIDIPVATGDDDEDIAGRVFRAMNVVDGTELPTKLHCRSMCVGDIVVVNGRHWRCESMGWKRLTLEEVGKWLQTVAADRHATTEI